MNNDLLARRLKPPSPAPATPIFAPAHAAQSAEPAPVVPEHAAVVPELTTEPLVFAEPTAPALAEVVPVAEVEPLAQVEPVAEVEPLAQVEPVAEVEQLAEVEPPVAFTAEAAVVMEDASDPFEPVWEGMVEPAWDSFDLQEAAALEPAPEAIWEVNESDREDAAPWQPAGEPGAIVPAAASEAVVAPESAALDTSRPSESSTDTESPLLAIDTAAEIASPVVSEEQDPRLSLFAEPEPDEPDHQPEIAALPAEQTNGHAPWPLDTLEPVAIAAPTLATVDEQPLADEPLLTDETPDVEALAAEVTTEPAPLLNEPLVDPQIFEAPPTQDEPPDDLLFGSWRSEPRGASVFGDMFAPTAAPAEPVIDPVEWPPVPIDAFPLHDRPVPNGELELPGELAILWPDTPRVQTFWPDLPAEPVMPPAVTVVLAPSEQETLPSVEPFVVEPQPATMPAFIPPPGVMADLPEPPPDPFGQVAGYPPTPPSLIFADLPPAAPRLESVPQPESAAQDGTFARFTSQASAFAERIPDHWSLMSQPMTTAGEEAAVHEPWHVQASALTVVMAIAVIGLVLTFIYLFTPLMR